MRTPRSPRWRQTLALTLAILALFAVPRPAGSPTHSRAVVAIDAMLDVFGVPKADAAGFSTALAGDISDWAFKQTQLPSPPTTLFVALAGTDPGDTCANELASSGAYARAQLNPDTNNSTNTNWNAKDQSSNTSTKSTNKLAITFPTATANWFSGSPILFYFIADSSTLTSGIHCLVSGSITGSGVVILNGNTLSFSAGSPGQLSFTID